MNAHVRRATKWLMTETVKVTPIKNCIIFHCHLIQMYTANLILTDIDECFEVNGCQQLCQNTDGSYICSCFSGFNLSSNGMDCNGELSV